MEFTSFEARTSVFVTNGRREPPCISSMPSLHLHGNLDEPVKGVMEFECSLHPEGQPTPGGAEVPSLGTIIRTRPCVCAVVGVKSEEFDRLWAMAMSGQLTHGCVTFTPPRYGTALIAAVSFSNVKEE